MVGGGCLDRVGLDWARKAESDSVPGAGERVSLAGTGHSSLQTQLIVPKSQPCFPLLILGVLWTLVKMGFVRWHGGRGHGGPSLSLEPFVSRVPDFLWRRVREGRLWQRVSLW